MSAQELSIIVKPDEQGNGQHYWLSEMGQTTYLWQVQVEKSDEFRTFTIQWPLMVNPWEAIDEIKRSIYRFKGSFRPENPLINLQSPSATKSINNFNRQYGPVMYQLPEDLQSAVTLRHFLNLNSFPRSDGQERSDCFDWLDVATPWWQYSLDGPTSDKPDIGISGTHQDLTELMIIFDRTTHLMDDKAKSDLVGKSLDRALARVPRFSLLKRPGATSPCQMQSAWLSPNPHFRLPPR